MKACTRTSIANSVVLVTPDTGLAGALVARGSAAVTGAGALDRRPACGGGQRDHGLGQYEARSRDASGGWAGARGRVVLCGVLSCRRKPAPQCGDDGVCRTCLCGGRDPALGAGSEFGIAGCRVHLQRPISLWWRIAIISQVIGHSGFNWAVRAISPMVLALVLLGGTDPERGVGLGLFSRGVRCRDGCRRRPDSWGDLSGGSAPKASESSANRVNFAGGLTIVPRTDRYRSEKSNDSST